MKKILLLSLSAILLFGVVGVSAGQLATLLDTVTGKKRVVNIGDKFRPNEVLYGAKVGARTDNPLKKYDDNYYLGSADHYTKFESDGTVSFVGSSTVFEDLRFPATAINPAGQVAPMTFDQTNIGFTAGATATTSIAVIAQMPHSYKSGSTILPHVHWMPTSLATSTVKWVMEYQWVDTGSTQSSTTWSYLSATSSAGGTLWKSQYTAFSGISGTGHTLSSILTIKLSRAAHSGESSDTYPDPVLLKEFDIHYEIDSVGSRTETSK